MESTNLRLGYSLFQARVIAPHTIRRSRFGYLSIRFDSGCSYPAMLELLRAVYKRTGCLIASGEVLSGPDWINRIVKKGYCISDQERASILTLMWALP
ncbi:hypothetical protein LX59_00711 [Azomonas agilis]|uniref:Uncharacterized protein n=1 Tax=Azomonas agilis TaxID=116849 RepID=A0A562J0G5_9GAMM|nr:hypothetical protein LX59_00711 [Azomonas agilis]